MQYTKSSAAIVIDDTYSLLGLILKTAASPVTFTAKQMYSCIVDEADGRYGRTRVREAVYYARKKGYIDDDYAITETGLARLNQLKLDKIQIPRQWDGIWRVVIFDIPESHRQARDQVRALIRRLSFIQLQKSVWVHPFPCTTQFKQIQDAYGVDHHISIIEAQSIDNDNQLRERFSAIYPDSDGFSADDR